MKKYEKIKKSKMTTTMTKFSNKMPNFSKIFTLKERHLSPFILIKAKQPLHFKITIFAHQSRSYSHTCMNMHNGIYNAINALTSFQVIGTTPRLTVLRIHQLPNLRPQNLTWTKKSDRAQPNHDQTGFTTYQYTFYNL